MGDDIGGADGRRGPEGQRQQGGGLAHQGQVHQWQSGAS